MSTTQPIETQLDNLQVLPSLDQLPEELLIHILALVPYSTKSLRALSQVNRCFCSIINPTRPQPFFKHMAAEQFPGAYTVLQTLGDGDYDLPVLDTIADTHDAALYILDSISSNLSLITNDLETDSPTWQSDFLHGLLAWETASRLHYSYSVAKDTTNKLHQLLPRDLPLWVRYVCAKLARCLFVHRTEWNVELEPADWIPAHYYGMDDRHSVGHLATALEQTALHGSRVNQLAGLLALCADTDAREAEPEHAARQFDCYLSFLDWADRFGLRLADCKGWRPGMSAETWLCDPRGIGERWGKGKIVQLQASVRRMIEAVNESGKLDLLEFVETHEPVSTAAGAGSGAGDLSSKIHDVVFEKNRTNQQTKILAEEALREGGQTPAEVSCMLATTYDWECALDTELLRGDSKLRRSLQPVSEVLKQTSVAFRTYKLEDCTSGLMRPGRNR